MIWMYIGITVLVIQLYVLTHTYTIEGEERWKYKIDFSEAKRLRTPVWVFMFIILLSSIPEVNVIEFTVFWTIWLKYYCESENEYKGRYTYWIFKDKFFSIKI